MRWPIFPHSFQHLFHCWNACSRVSLAFPRWAMMSSGFHVLNGHWHVNILIFSKNQLLVSVVCFTVFSVLYFINFYCNFHYFLPSAHFRLSLLFFSQHLKMKARLLIWDFFFLNSGTYSYKFPCKYCLSCTLNVLVCRILIFIYLKVFLISLFIYLWPIGI